MELKTDEGRVFGARYYTVHPILSFFNNSDMDEWANMVTWCVETLGPTSKDGVFTPGSRWYVNNAKFWFRSEQDQLLFVLRWQ